MDLGELLANHRSIRRYKPDPVPRDVLERVLAAGLRASSSGNMQAYSVVVTTDVSLRQQLFDLHWQQKMVLEAPCLLTFVSDFHRMRQWLELSSAPLNFDNFMSFMIGAIDAVLAAQNVALAAQNEGLGICFMGTTLANCAAIGGLLRLPPNAVPVCGFVLGYPDEAPTPRDRLPLEGLVHWETYQDYAPERTRDVYRSRETAGWERYMNVPELRAKVEAAGLRNLAELYTLLKYTRESHQEHSRVVLDYLQAQHFFEQ